MILTVSARLPVSNTYSDQFFEDMCTASHVEVKPTHLNKFVMNFVV